MTTSQKPSLFGAIFLVSGTSIGAGMLAQPVAASIIGFIPSTLMMFVAWAFMTSTALILLEVSLWMKPDTHIISMAGNFLGPVGKLIAWIVYLFIAYLSLTAYISGGGDVLATAVRSISPFQLPAWLQCVVFVLIFGFVIEISSKAVGRLNSILFVGLVVSYLLIVGLGAEGVEAKNLLSANFSQAYFIVPLLLTSFSFQMIIPSLANYLERDRTRLRIAIILGTSLSFVIYLLWNMVVLGHLGTGLDGGLAAAYAEGRPPTSALSGTEQSWFAMAVHTFAFLALVTSFIGISWGLFDFLADGLKIRKVGKNRIGLWLLVMSPPLFIALTYPRAFIGALESTGGYGDTIINGIIPVLMFWIGHYQLKKASASRFLGNRVYLTILLFFAVSVMTIEFGRQLSLF